MKNVNETEALATVRRLALQGRVAITPHAGVERAYRHGGVRHVHWALRNVENIRASRADQSSDWVVTGPDLDGDDLDLAVLIEADVVVITILG